MTKESYIILKSYYLMYIIIKNYDKIQTYSIINYVVIIIQEELVQLCDSAKLIMNSLIKMIMQN